VRPFPGTPSAGPARHPFAARCRHPFIRGALSPVEEFRAKDRNISRCLNPDADLLTPNFQDPDSDA
jgi:hypothetical protein